ncbi:carbon-nitrogen hydrolase family protein [Parablautia intestinalis]|uniref:Carbon-nitrogen hydrolase family protein n=1 Tax=Parablautia intestinalis TaxID=2320100 RepID=A0A3A9B5K9_9FIRM|nr:carbon-nitrogen hydrolase family protein [Parablautia intestinalis]RKI94085.1 carbon-nitrogen hydrolase family protein [Parablautia intestinalis]
MNVLLAVPKKNNSIRELNYFLSQYEADFYVFPEGFLDSHVLQEALDMIKKKEKYVITGFKDLKNKGQHKALVIDGGMIVDEYTKCILTKEERQKGKKNGENIFCVNTKFGKIGIPVCYEIHFPEVSRIMCLDNPVLLINIIGTGMYHNLQLEQWTSLAKARAIENEIYVIGSSHFEGEIPLAYAFEPSGRCILLRQKEYGGFIVEIDLEKSRKKVIQYCDDRVPGLFYRLTEG